MPLRVPPLSALPASPRWVLTALFASSLGVGLIFGFQPPLIAFVLSRAGASSFAVGSVTAVSLIAVIVLGPFYPRAIARLGLKGCIMTGVAAAAAILLLMGLWPRFTVWLGLRFLSGCVLGLAWIGSEVWMNVASSAASRGMVMGIYGAVFSTGVVLGPLLLEVTGTSGWKPFVCGALCLLVTLMPLALLRQAKAEMPASRPAAGLIHSVRFAPLVMQAAVVAGLVESADLALLPLFGLHSGLSERGSLALLAVFMAGNVALQLPIGLLADRFGRRRLLGYCALLSAVGPLLLPACIRTPVLLAPLLFVWGGTLYAFYSQGIALLGEEFPASELAAANTAFVIVYCAGGVIGPSLGGLTMDLWPRFGLPALLTAAPLVLLTCLAAGALTAKSASRPRAP